MQFSHTDEHFVLWQNFIICAFHVHVALELEEAWGLWKIDNLRVEHW